MRYVPIWVMSTLLPLLTTACTTVANEFGTPEQTFPSVAQTTPEPANDEPRYLSLDEARTLAEFPLLIPTELPEGYVFEAASVQRQSDRSQLIAIFYSSDDGKITLNQWSRQLPISPEDESLGKTISLRGQEAWLGQNSDGTYTLSWNEAGTHITLYTHKATPEGSPALEWETLRQVVESMQPAESVFLSEAEQARPPQPAPSEPLVEPTPDLSDIPTTPAPHNLDAIAIPTTLEEAEALFEELPTEVAGLARADQGYRSSRDRIIIGYGTRENNSPLLVVQALDVTSGEFYPVNWRGAHVVAKHPLESEAYGREGDIVWVYGKTRVQPVEGEAFTSHILLWGSANSPLVLSVSADSKENLETLAVALVEATK